jgi:hypothetical protein
MSQSTIPPSERLLRLLALQVHTHSRTNLWLVVLAMEGLAALLLFALHCCR